MVKRRRPRELTKAQSQELSRWHQSETKRHQEYGLALKELLERVLGRAGVDIQAVFQRTKEEQKFLEKAHGYSNPRADINDFCGLRVIVYFASATKDVEKVLRDLFEVEVTDKAEELGDDRMGYRATHFVCSMKEDRASKPEWADYKDIRFEVQVTTVLGHAWAEFEHDRRYKGEFQLPPDLSRRLMLVSGLLEVADHELDSLADEISAYEGAVSKGVEAGNEAISGIGLDSLSVRQLLVERLPEAVSSGKMDDDWNTSKAADLAVSELIAFGVNNLSELAALIPRKYQQALLRLRLRSSLIGVVRDLMMISDADRYFDRAWRRSWGAWHIESMTLLQEFGLDATDLMVKHDLSIEPDSD